MFLNIEETLRQQVGGASLETYQTYIDAVQTALDTKALAVGQALLAEAVASGNYSEGDAKEFLDSLGFSFPAPEPSNGDLAGLRESLAEMRRQLDQIAAQLG